MKPQKWAEEDGPALEVVLILKWGGDITPLGREQAEMLGAQFRHNMYPDTEGVGSRISYRFAGNYLISILS